MTEINENKEVATTEPVNEQEQTVEEAKTPNLSESEYKIIIDSVKEFKEQYETLKSTVVSFVTESSGLEESSLLHILRYAGKDIRSIDVEELRDFLDDHMINYDGRFDNLSDDEIYELVEKINKSSIMIHDMEKQYKEIMDESGEIMNEYIAYMNSNRMNNTIAERINAMKAAAELETDSYQKSKIVKMIDALESCETYSYLFERFNNAGIEKEVKNLKDTYFDKRRSAYVIKRYNDKIAAFGFKNHIYRYFFNIEENFLPEKYHVFNNFTLFMYMRIVGYADPYNKKDQLVVKSFTGAFTNLIYHRFESKEKEDQFLAAIMKVLDLFEEHAVYFEVNNLTHPNHPVRIQNEKIAEERRRNKLKQSMRRMGITGYESDWSSTQLMEFMNAEIEKRREEQEKTVVKASGEVLEEQNEYALSGDEEELPEEEEEDVDAEIDAYIAEENKKIEDQVEDENVEEE